MPAHGHAFFEVLFITSGRGLVSVAERKHAASPGAVFVIPPGVLHDCRDLGTATGWSLLFLADGVHPEHEQGLGLLDDVPAGLVFDVFRRPMLSMADPLLLDEPTLRRTEELIREMANELALKRDGYEVAVRAAMQLILVGIARCADRDSATTEKRFATPRDQQLLKAAFADIDLHFKQQGTLSEAAARLGLSAGYLTTRLRVLTGRPYGDWVIERRMIEARRLLSSGGHSVATIAESIGYVEVESFVRRFKEHHGLSPSAWREAALPENPRLAKTRTGKN